MITYTLRTPGKVVRQGNTLLGISENLLRSISVTTGEFSSCFRDKLLKIQYYRAKNVCLRLCNVLNFVIFSGEILGNFEQFRNSGKFGENTGKFSPGKFREIFPEFSGDETYVTALILSFKKLKINEISLNYESKFPRKYREIFSENAGKFSPNFSAFFWLNAMYQPWICLLKSCNFNAFQEILEKNFRKFREISENIEKVFREIPGNFPPDFPGFSGDETHVTAVILSF